MNIIPKFGKYNTYALQNQLLMSSPSDIITQAQAQWDAFPERFRLDGPLKYCVQQPVVRDFLVNAKLTHLHVLFLLRMAVTRSRPASDIQLVSISADILSLIVEAILQKDCLVNSGTSLVWKV